MEQAFCADRGLPYASFFDSRLYAVTASSTTAAPESDSAPGFSPSSRKHQVGLSTGSTLATMAAVIEDTPRAPRRDHDRRDRGDAPKGNYPFRSNGNRREPRRDDHKTEE